jgi:predicted MFS family arabinose efflux permease
VDGLRRLIAVLRDRDVALLFAGGLLSRIGDGFTIVAVSWLLAERGSPQDLGLFFLVYEVAAITGGLALTGILDAASRRLIMVVDCVVRGVAVAAIPFADLVFGESGLGVLLASAAVLGLFSPAADVASRAMVVGLVDEQDLTAANAAESVTWTVTWLVGPALGGVLVATIGSLPTLWIDSVTFFAFAAALLAMSPRADHLPEREDARRSFVGDLREGLAYVRREKLMLTIIQLTAGARFVEGALIVALPFLVIDVGGGAGAYGIIIAALGLGSLLGSLLTAAVPLGVRMTRAITGFAIVNGAAVLVLALRPPLWVIAVLFLAESTVTAPWNIYLLTMRQRVPPAHLVGRVLSLTMLLNRAGQPAGSAAGGALLGPLGLAGLLGACGVLQVGNAASTVLSRRWWGFPMRAGEPEPVAVEAPADAPFGPPAPTHPSG